MVVIVLAYHTNNLVLILAVDASELDILILMCVCFFSIQTYQMKF